jgi:cytochrome c oxidase subunit II
VIDRLLPAAASAHAAAFDAVLTSVHVHMAVQAVAWGAFFIWCLVRFRRSARGAGSSRSLPTIVPVVAVATVIVGDALLLATRALPVWLERSRPPSADLRPLEVHVVAEQFAWNVHYPGPDRRFGPTRNALISASNPLGIDRSGPGGADDIGLLNILTVPVNRPVIVRLTSRDVVHSFTLNEMRVRQDATPGLTVRTWFTPIATGRWEIACSQLCGLGHYRMRGTFTVLEEDAWTAWVEREVALLRRARQ